MATVTGGWFFWAALSACFAALTAIFAKIGIQGVDSDYATLVRTIVIVFVLAALAGLADKWSDPRELRPRTLLFLSLSALATGASWVCYFRALQLGEALVRSMLEATGQPPAMWGTGIVGFGACRYKYASGREGVSCLYVRRLADLDLSVLRKLLASTVNDLRQRSS